MERCSMSDEEVMQKFQVAQAAIAAFLHLNHKSNEVDALKLVTVTIHQIIAKIMGELLLEPKKDVTGQELCGIISKSLFDIGSVYVHKNEVH